MPPELVPLVLAPDQPAWRGPCRFCGLPLQDGERVDAGSYPVHTACGFREVYDRVQWCVICYLPLGAEWGCVHSACVARAYREDLPELIERGYR